MDAAERAVLCRRIASSGGKATVAKYGTGYMSDIAREGGYATFATYGESFMRQIGSAGKAACIAKHGLDRWQYVTRRGASL